MSEEKDTGTPEESAQEDDAMRALLKRTAATEESVAQPDLLRGVQRKIRKRSKGKFYADGWSTTHSRVNYALIAVAMLLVIAIAYFALGPMGFSAK